MNFYVSILELEERRMFSDLFEIVTEQETLLMDRYWKQLINRSCQNPPLFSLSNRIYLIKRGGLFVGVLQSSRKRNLDEYAESERYVC